MTPLPERLVAAIAQYLWDRRDAQARALYNELVVAANLPKEDRDAREQP